MPEIERVGDVGVSGAKISFRQRARILMPRVLELEFERCGWTRAVGVFMACFPQVVSSSYTLSQPLLPPGPPFLLLPTLHSSPSRAFPLLLVLDGIGGPGTWHC